MDAKKKRALLDEDATKAAVDHTRALYVVTFGWPPRNYLTGCTRVVCYAVNIDFVLLLFRIELNRLAHAAHIVVLF